MQLTAGIRSDVLIGRLDSLESLVKLSLRFHPVWVNLKKLDAIAALAVTFIMAEREIGSDPPLDAIRRAMYCFADTHGNALIREVSLIWHRRDVASLITVFRARLTGALNVNRWALRKLCVIRVFRFQEALNQVLKELLPEDVLRQLHEFDLTHRIIIGKMKNIGGYSDVFEGISTAHNDTQVAIKRLRVLGKDDPLIEKALTTPF